MWRRIGIGLSLGLLAACSSAMLEPVQSNARVLGVVELTLGDVSASGLKAQAITADLAPGLSIQAVVGGGYPKKVDYACGSSPSGLCRIVTNKFTVKNNRATYVNDLTLVAYNRATGIAPTLEGTNLRNLKNSSGALITTPLMARLLVPAHGFNAASAPSVNFEEADMHFVPSVPGQPSALGYGFAAHGPFNQTQGYIARSLSRWISSGETGTVFVTYRFNLPTDITQRVSTYSMVFLATSSIDDVPAHSESLEDRAAKPPTVVGLMPGEIPFGRLFYTAGSTLPGRDYGLGVNMGCIITAASSGSLPSQTYTSCPVS